MLIYLKIWLKYVINDFYFILDKKRKMKNIISAVIFFVFTFSYTQNHTVSLSSNHFTNMSVNYELETSKSYNLKLGISRSLVNGSSSNKKTKYNFSSISAKIFDGDIWDFDIYHGPGVLIGYYYEYTNFRIQTLYYPIPINNYSNYQSSAMISPQYHVGLEREIWDNILASGELAAGAHFLFNDNMTILAKYNIGNLVPYIALNISIGYRF